jgi:hypothetical protein
MLFFRPQLQVELHMCKYLYFLYIIWDSKDKSVRVAPYGEEVILQV